MWTYLDVKAADAALAIADPAAAAVGLNAQTVTSGAIDLTWSAMRDVLMNNFDWGTLVVVAQTAIGATLPGGGTQTVAILAAADALHECCLHGGTFNSSNATVWGRLMAAAGLLTPAAVGGISSASANAVVALRTPITAKWIPALSDNDVVKARAS